MRYKISDIASINAENLSKKEKLKFINYLDTANLTDGLFGEIKKLEPGVDTIPSRAQRKVKRNDILISTVRPNQRHYGIVKEVLPNMIVSTGFVVLTPDELKVNADYLYFYLTQEEITSFLSQIAENSTSAYPSITPKVIADLEIDLPPIKEQNFIANLLSSLSAKIELNNRINKTLEEMAQAIFKQWFVDFDFPDENGQPYKSSGGEMEESEMGLIPKGWKVGMISDLGEIVGGGTPSKKEVSYYASLGIPWITPKDLSDNRNKYISRGSLDISELGYKNSSAKKMPKGTVLFSSRAPIGYVAIAKNEVTTNQGFKSIIPYSHVGSEFVYYFLKWSTDLIESRASGSTFKEISGGEMKKIPAIVPETKILAHFNDIVGKMGKQMEKCEEENQIMINIRDSLLPKLMSGEIRVPVEDQQEYLPL